MDAQQRMIAKLVGDVIWKVRVQFGVIEGMTPERVLSMSNAVGSTLLDHISRIRDVGAITDEDGHLRVPTPSPDQEDSSRAVS